jgi:hypothetical protein
MLERPEYTEAYTLSAAAGSVGGHRDIILQYAHPYFENVGVNLVVVVKGAIYDP